MDITVKTSEAPVRPEPWWARLFPTTNHVLVILLAFAIAGGLLLMIRENPKLLANASFMQLATMLATLAVVIVNNLFSGTKTGSQVMASQNDALVKQAAPPAEPKDGANG